MLVELQSELGARGLQIVGIAVDKRDLARDFAQQAQVNYPILYGVQSALEVSQLYGNDAGTLPHTAIIDRHGIVRHIMRGELERDQLESVLAPLL
jgi:peroxiredoxin